MKLSDLLVPSTKYSKFRCDTYKKFSANPGILYPVWYNLLNPGESAIIDLRSVIRTWPVESPLMGSMKVRFVTAAFNLKNYAIALEGYKRSFDWRSTLLPFKRHYYTTDTSTSSYRSLQAFDDETNVLVNKPYLLGVRRTSLADYLGYEDGWFPSISQYGISDVSNPDYVDKSFLPFICYYDFYRNYLVNPQEGFFPMFQTRYEINYRSNPYEDNQSMKVLDTRSVVSNMPITLLDNFIENCHKYYDGDAQLGINVTNSPVKGSFDNLFTWNTNILSSNLSFNPNSSVGNTFSSFHGGLVSTMFDPDINTQWMSVDNYTKFNEVKINTNVDSQSGATFSSFADIVKASSLWDFVTKSVNSDGTYGDFIGNQFGVSVKGDLNIPQIVHVYDTLLSFDDITSQSATEDAVIGQQAGVGRSFGQSNHFKVFNKDGNYVMLMTFMWITPQVCYNSGLGHLHSICSFSDLYQPSFDNYAMQARLNERLHSSTPSYYFDLDGNVTAVSHTCDDAFLYPILGNKIVPYDYPVGYQPAWSDYKTDIDVVHGLFRKELDYYTIIRDLPAITNTSILGINDRISSYVYSPLSWEQTVDAQDAQRYSLPFAIEQEDCCQVQLRVGCTITRSMSKNVNPNIK